MIEPDDLPPIDLKRRPLTPAQSAIAGCLLDAMSDKEIARACGIGLRTLEAQKKLMIERWGLRNSRELLIEIVRMTERDGA